MAKACLELKEAHGRKVKKMTVFYDEDYVAVEVLFVDGNSMNVDILAAVKIRPQFQKLDQEDNRILRNYGSQILVIGEPKER